MSEGDGGTTPRPAHPGLVAVAAVAATLLVLLLAVWAATAGPDDPLRGGGITPDRVPVSPSATESVGPAGPDEVVERDPAEASSTLPAVVGFVVLAAGVALGALLVWLVVSTLWRLRRLRPRRAERDPEPDGHDSVLAVSAALAADADEQELRLTEGDPRNAVVECWHRFEQSAERAGLPRQPAETSAEFTVRLLGLVDADPTTVRRLVGLYREARFSEHEVGEDARTAALEAVRDLHRSLRASAARGAR